MNLHVLIRAWDLPAPVTFRSTKLGYFNETHFVEAPAGCFVLRIYQPGGDLARLRHEQAMMTRLQSAGLPFAVPAPIPSRSGETLVRAEGAGPTAYASLIPFIPGDHPDPGNLGQGYAMGRALGCLMEAMAALPASEDALKAPTYGDLHRAHPRVPAPQAVPALLPATQPDRYRIAELIDQLLAEIPALYTSLPRQLTHGDFVPRNVLMAGDRLTGVLDFEFSAKDLRAMDLANTLGGGPDSLRKRQADWDVLESICRGYFSCSRLTPAEIAAIPLLVRLRRVNMLLRFFGRYQEGLDSEGFLRGIIFWLLEADDWLTANGDELVRLLNKEAPRQS